MSTPTPRTDAQEWTETNRSNAVVLASFARELERELAQAWKGEEVASRDFRMTLADLGQARRELAAERARLRQLALDACRAAAIVPLVWYPEGYYVNPNDLGKINKQQVDACVAAVDAAMKEDTK